MEPSLQSKKLITTVAIIVLKSESRTNFDPVFTFVLLQFQLMQDR